MRSFLYRQRVGLLAIVLAAVLSGDELRAQSPSNPRFDALVSLTEAKMKEFGVPGVALGIIDGPA